MVKDSKVMEDEIFTTSVLNEHYPVPRLKQEACGKKIYSQIFHNICIQGDHILQF